ncbi:class I SAM-dependent methyltransferase [Streptomyces sp. NRRL B-24484]|uniref:class I SAM-dependent methyltransferase n=1 Tax=Streptomyces sp. NRRL B-24484 TaxID=1463833 RepID=UPI0009975FDF|nr:methyltransferase domain-containing protein [Streptomyces sp. NRRL B-24484]
MASAQVTGTTAQRPHAGGGAGSHGRARDWAEIQERMLVPLYQAVYRRLEVGPATSLLGLGCRSGLALLLAAERGAQVAGLEPEAELRELAEGRRLRVAGVGGVDRSGQPVPRSAYSLVTVFEELAYVADPAVLVLEAAALTLQGGHVVLAGWGPPERCESAGVLEVARRRSARTPSSDPFALSAPGALEELCAGVGLRPAGSGRVSCPFAYPDLDSAVRGMLSTGLYEGAIEEWGPALVTKELEEALHPFVQADASVRMANVFRYVVAEQPR